MIKQFHSLNQERELSLFYEEKNEYQTSWMAACIFFSQHRRKKKRPIDLIDTVTLTTNYTFNYKASI